MNFWVRNIIIGGILIALAVALLANQDMLFALTEGSAEEPVPELESLAEVKETKEEHSITINKSKNAAAEGLSRFYANLHGDFDDNSDGPKIRNNVVFLPDPQGDLVEILEARRMVTRPLRKTWKGKKESRPFRAGQTLLQKLAEYAEEERLEVIWWINKDFIVKDPFRVNKDIVKTSLQIANAIGGHYHHGVSAYFCYKHRALVLIENENKNNFDTFDYLNDQCSLLGA